MNSRITVFFIALLCVIIAVAGCIGTPTSPAPLPATQASQQTAAGGTSAATSDTSLVPTTTDSLGNARNVIVNIEKDHLAVVHATFQGGPGLIHVKKIDVTMNRSDGEVKSTGVGIKVDDTAQLEGTKADDRVMVFVTLDDGKTYKIYDELVGYKPR